MYTERRFPTRKVYNREAEDEMQPSTESLPYYPEKRWPTRESKPYRRVEMKSSKTYGAGSQLKVNPETLFNFVSSPFEASKLPSPNLNLTSPTETE